MRLHYNLYSSQPMIILIIFKVASYEEFTHLRNKDIVYQDFLI